MKIALCSIGSRGDIQPFLILGNALTEAGHEVRFCSAKMYADLASKYKVNFIPFEGDYERLTNDEDMKKLIGKNPFTISNKLQKHVYPVLESSMHGFYEASKWADLVVFHPKTLIDAFGHELSHKFIKAYVIPAFTTTKAFRSPILGGVWMPSFLNRWSYKITIKLMNTVKKPIQNFYKKQQMDNAQFKWYDAPTIYGISPNFLPQPSDYPNDHHFSGFWLDKDSNHKLDDSITSFWNNDKKKLVITFGSMPYKSSIHINDFINGILIKHDINIIVVRGWGLKDAKINPHKNLLVVDNAPFNKLFPLADAIVHHGGAGTTAIALRSGTPMMICPILHPVGDQIFWGKQVYSQGVGVYPIPLAKLSIKKLTSSVGELLNKDFSLACNKMKEALSKENGLKKAVELIEHYGSNRT